MARFNFSDVDKYATNSTKKNVWLSLSNDGDSALVQFPFNSLEEIFCENIHKVRAVSKAGIFYDMRVSCLRQSYEDELAKCPFCSSEIERTQEFYIPVIDYNTGESLLWSRSKTFIEKIFAYTIQNTPNFSNTVFKIVRCGAKGNKKTTYNLFPQFQLQAKDFSNIKSIDPIGIIIKEKTYDEMMAYLKNGEFPIRQQEQPIQQQPQPQTQPQMQQYNNNNATILQQPKQSQMQQPMQQSNRVNFNNINTQLW